MTKRFSGCLLRRFSGGSIFFALVVGLGCATFAERREMEIRKNGSMWAQVESDGTIRINGAMVGQFEDDGTVRKNGSMIGEVETDGTIRHQGSMVGRIEPDGTLRINGRMMGEIESDGTIRREGSLWGEAKPCCLGFFERRVVAAVIVFFSGTFLVGK